MLSPHTLTAALAALLLASPSAWAVNKCKDAQGRTVYQERPCADGKGTTIDATPAAGYGTPQPTANTEAGSTTQPAAPAAPPKKKEDRWGEKWHRMTYLENRGVPDARANLAQHNYDCEQKMRALEAEKNRANNNLAGAAWMQAISAQMQAEATLCASRGQQLHAEKDKLEKEMRELQAERK